MLSFVIFPLFHYLASVVASVLTLFKTAPHSEYRCTIVSQLTALGFRLPTHEIHRSLILQ
jgi:hypothetical protein